MGENQEGNVVITDDILGTVLNSMEDALTVGLIASRPLVVCTPEEIAAEVFQVPQCASLDRLPVRNNDRIIGVLERDTAGTSSLLANECMKTLQEGMLVSASTGILEYIRLSVGRPYHLVIESNAINGIVTRSDLLKLPVRIALFALLTRLETIMTLTIRSLFPDETWLRYLSDSRKAKLMGEYEKGKKRNIYADILSFSQWADKREILSKGIIRTRTNVMKTFDKDLEALNHLRDNVMHANDYVSDSGVLNEHINRCTYWIDSLKQIQEGGLK